MMKPSPADIAIAIAKAELGDWIDPTDVPLNWSCELYTPNGERAGDGNAHTAAEAMALAWLCAWAPNALIDRRVEVNSVPYDVPDGWRFELTPPWQSKRD
jgi:hypothetical protein